MADSSRGRPNQLSPENLARLQDTSSARPDGSLSSWVGTYDRSLSTSEVLYGQAQRGHAPDPSREADMAMRRVEELFGPEEDWPPAPPSQQSAAERRKTTFQRGRGTSSSTSSTRTDARQAPASTTVACARGRDAEDADLLTTSSHSSSHSSSVPSLVDGATAESSSINTSLVSAENRAQTATVRQVPTAQESDEPPDPTSLRCVFSFLSCRKEFDDIGPWRDHCNSHLQRCQLPESMGCNLCPGQDFSWTAYLDHFATDHDHHDPEQERPDAGLLRYLFRKELISNTDYHVLVKHGNIKASAGIWAESHSNPRERRRMARKNFILSRT